jgi:hypothetical protein
MSAVKLDHALRVISAAETKAREIGQHIRMTWNRNRLSGFARKVGFLCATSDVMKQAGAAFVYPRVV